MATVIAVRRPSVCLSSVSFSCLSQWPRGVRIPSISFRLLGRCSCHSARPQMVTAIPAALLSSYVHAYYIDVSMSPAIGPIALFAIVTLFLKIGLT